MLFFIGFVCCSDFFTKFRAFYYKEIMRCTSINKPYMGFNKIMIIYLRIECCQKQIKYLKAPPFSFQVR
jgi:hypothetical protein